MNGTLVWLLTFDNEFWRLWGSRRDSDFYRKRKGLLMAGSARSCLPSSLPVSGRSRGAATITTQTFGCPDRYVKGGYRARASSPRLPTYFLGRARMLPALVPD